MCFEMAGSVRSNGSASSLTVASPRASRARIARRVELANTAKVSLSRSSSIASVIGRLYFPPWLINRLDLASIAGQTAKPSPQQPQRVRVSRRRRRQQRSGGEPRVRLAGEVLVVGHEFACDERRALRIVDDRQPRPGSVEGWDD